MYPSFSEFGLYRYNSNGKRRNKSGCFSSIIVYSILAMSIIFGILLYVFINGRINETNSQRISNSTQNLNRNDTKSYEQIDLDTFENVTDENVGLEVIEISSKNYTESHAKRIKRLDSEDDSNVSPESQKLTFYPNRALKPPRIAQKTRAIHYPSLPPNHKISSRRFDPRSYHFATMQPKPHEFLRPPTVRTLHGNHVNNIQDVISQHNYHPVSHLITSASEMMNQNPVQLAGSYRHPRTNGNLAQIFEQAKPQTLKAEASDPFQNFKPISPHDINQMLNQHANDENMKYLGITTSDAPYFRRKFRQKNYNNQANDAAATASVTNNIYGNGLKRVSKKRVQNRNEQGKPFSVMLDVYPFSQENDFSPSFIQTQNMRRLKPLLNRYYQDPQMFNGINFPQVMPRYPAYFRYQNYPRQQQQHQQQASTSYGTIQNHNGMLKPSQLVVHLNLYPKNNSPTYKRSSSEDLNSARPNQHEFQRPIRVNGIKNQSIDVSTTPFNINFNVHTGNGHPENIAHQKQLEFNRTSTEASLPQNYNNNNNNNNYFYEDEEDDEAVNQSYNVQPSMVYKDIYRDKPIHLMLKNTTANTTKKPKNKSKAGNNSNNYNNYNNNANKYEKYEKSKNLKFHYQTIDRPKAKYHSVVKPKTFGPFY